MRATTKTAGMPASDAAGVARTEYFDVLRTLAIVAVILVHVSAPVVSAYGDVPRSWWWCANALDSASRWCVPIFVMVSGALLLGSERVESVAVFWRRRAARVGVPLVFWSAFYFGWRAYFHGERLEGARVILDLWHGAPYYHLYFLFLIAGLYVITPALRRLLRNSRPATIRVTIIGALVLTSTWRIGRWALHSSGDNISTLWMPYAGYYLAGWKLSRLDMTTRTAHRASWGVLIFCVSFTAAGVGLCAAHGKVGGGISLLYAYESPLIAAMSIAVFVVGMRCRSGRIIRLVAPASFGVYLTHVAILDLFERCTKPIVTMPPWYAAPAATLTVFTVSLVLVRCLQAIPVVRRVVG